MAVIEKCLEQRGGYLISPMNRVVVFGRYRKGKIGHCRRKEKGDQ